MNGRSYSYSRKGHSMKREPNVLQGGTEKYDAFRILQKVVGMIRAMAPWGKGRGRGTGPCALSQGLDFILETVGSR